MPSFKCEYYGECANADSGKIIELTSSVDPKCPVCNQPLKPVIADGKQSGGGDDGISSTSSGGGIKPQVMIASAVAGLALVGGAAYFALSSKSPPKQVSTPQVPIASAPVTVAPPKPANPDSIAPKADELEKQKKDADDCLLGKKKPDECATADKAASTELIKSGVAKLKQGKLPEAEEDFEFALKKDPKSYLAYYNLGVLKLRQNKKDESYKYFESSFIAGFPYFDKMEQDEDMKPLLKDPKFSALVAKYKK